MHLSRQDLYTLMEALTESMENQHDEDEILYLDLTPAQQHKALARLARTRDLLERVSREIVSGINWKATP